MYLFSPGLLIFLALWILLELYVFRLLVHSIFQRDGGVGKRGHLRFFKINPVFSIVYWIVPILLLINWSVQVSGLIHYSDVQIWIYVNAVFFIFYITKISLALLGLVSDSILGIGQVAKYFGSKTPFDPSRKKFLKSSAAIVGFLPLPTLFYGMIRNPYRYRLHKVEVPIENLPDDLDGLRIVQISDMHAGSWFFKQPVEKAVEIINDQEADLIVFTGDLVNNKATEMDPFVDLFSGLKSSLGVYSILGNHDYGDYYRWEDRESKRENFQHLLKIHELMNWKLLRNEHECIKVKDTTFAVVGVENFSALPQFPKYGDLKKATAGLEQDLFKILLTHDPSHWDAEVANKRRDIPLVLSGHTHGFQFGFEIPGVARWSPSSLVYNQWAGLYNNGKQYLYVNRGLGFLGYPGRVGILPEITHLVLRKKV